ncbi:MAG: SDR family oxidoreductase [SAR202 cluster bacterium]|nr:SDR family oxidoreductase [SAR202 cluster bacterium]MDP6716204.1 SDR family oxidoreductase [SAR202 cluster bacterium]
MSSLENQVAIVTGGAMGIGGATSRNLAASGAKVLIADIAIDSAETNARTIRESGGTALAVQADVSTASGIQSMIDRAIEEWGRLDILVSNAFSPGAEGNQMVLDTTEEQWDSGMALLVKAIFLGAKYAVPHMAKQGAGSIVNISSVHGMLTAPGSLIYEAGKSAVIGATRQMATEFGPMGIRVNAICPGHIVTERMQSQWDANPSGLEFFKDQYPLRKVGKPDDIANAVGFLCSDAASFITGHALVVDGGLTVQIQENFGVRQAHFLQDNPDTVLPY